MTRGNGLVITILTCNLTSTSQGFDIAKDALITFCFTLVSCDIQIRQLINDIKCASALGDCVPLSSATVINIRILLKATSYFSPSLHYVSIFTSRIFLNKKDWVNYWVYHCLNLKLRLRQYPSTLLSLSYHKYYKGANDKDIRNDFTILYVRYLIRLLVHDLRNLQPNYKPVLVTNITFLVLYAKNEVAVKIVRVSMPMLWVVLGRTPI